MDDEGTSFDKYLNNKLTAFLADRHPGVDAVPSTLGTQHHVPKHISSHVHST
jgi:hypothetical protein